ncbi:BMP family ABC transporter substrate-binding protein [uncultured Fibrobacter sp.]|uniref:BMP family ABC transporter substrate-binding protein n=1 Tax=uncultured Fibrobacter sp. TaxID=261512 RepID=UPI00261FE55A|nr:BMP family ABC transporter substrate-binding protein [uncultured Fibrobacter sp.]
MIRLVKFFAAIAVACLVAIFLMLKDSNTGAKVNDSPMRIAVVMTGPRLDHSWNESHYIALEKVSRELNLEIAYYDNVPTNSMAEEIMERAIANGAQIVIANSFGFGDAVARVAHRHPETKFFHATGERVYPNVLTFMGRIYQMWYLSGIVAGLMTKNNRVGYLASMNISEVNRGINAFTLGVRKVNPEANVYVSWSGSWFDENMAATATQYLVDTCKVDVFSVKADVNRPYEMAEEKGVWIIGCNLDNSQRYLESFLTAPIWHWENFYRKKINEVKQNKFVARSEWLGIESGIMDLAPMAAAVSDSVRQIVESEWHRLEERTFDVFYGPIEDNHGRIHVGPGESMTDEEMQHRFNWYVKGVVDGL